MPEKEEIARKTEPDLLRIAITDVALSPKERKVTWTPWPALNILRLCFSLIVQLAPAIFWATALALKLPMPTFLVFVWVGIAYCLSYIIIRRFVIALSKPSALDFQKVDWFIDADGFRRTSLLFDIKFEKESFASITEDKGRYLFFTSSQVCIVLPKRCVSTEQIAPLRAIIAAWPRANLRHS
jgi:hypothetical protein